MKKAKIVCVLALVLFLGRLTVIKSYAEESSIWTVTILAADENEQLAGNATGFLVMNPSEDALWLITSSSLLAGNYKELLVLDKGNYLTTASVVYEDVNGAAILKMEKIPDQMYYLNTASMSLIPSNGEAAILGQLSLEDKWYDIQEEVTVSKVSENGLYGELSEVVLSDVEKSLYCYLAGGAIILPEHGVVGILLEDGKTFVSLEAVLEDAGGSRQSGGEKDKGEKQNGGQESGSQESSSQESGAGESDARESEGRQSDAREAGSQPASQLPWILILAAGGAFYLYRTSQRKREKVFLIGKSGFFQGKEIPITGELTIGRDPDSCAVLYPSGEKGISRKHCRLWLESGKVMLSDMGSSYGTYLLDGTKLEEGQRVPLGPGDGFYLASPENAFYVK